MRSHISNYIEKSLASHALQRYHARAEERGRRERQENGSSMSAGETGLKMDEHRNMGVRMLIECQRERGIRFREEKRRRGK